MTTAELFYMMSVNWRGQKPISVGANSVYWFKRCRSFIIRWHK